MCIYIYIYVYQDDIFASCDFPKQLPGFFYHHNLLEELRLELAFLLGFHDSTTETWPLNGPSIINCIWIIYLGKLE